MPLKKEQIAQLLQQARDLGLDADELEAVEWFLNDRAAELDGATRLDVALSLLGHDETQGIAQFLTDMQQLREDAIQRATDDLMSMSDDEWQSLIEPSGEDSEK